MAHFIALVPLQGTVVMVDVNNEPGELPTDGVLVRSLTRQDLAAIIRIDKAEMDRERAEYYQAKVEANLEQGKLQTSLVAEFDDHVVGFLLAKVFYGEFGQAEPVAVIDSLGVDPGYRKRHVGGALMRQIVMNLGALGVEHIQTQVGWQQSQLIGFLARHGFEPAPRLCLELRL